MTDPVELPGGIEMPQRRQVELVQCRCLIIHPNGMRDRCPQTTESPDEPFCWGCADVHQVEHPAVSDGAVVTAVPVNGTRRG